MGIFDFLTSARRSSILSIGKKAHTYPPRLDDADALYLCDIELWDRLVLESESAKGDVGSKKVYTSWVNYIKSIADYNPPKIQRDFFGRNEFGDDSFPFAIWVECEFLDCRIHQKFSDGSLEIVVYLKYEELSFRVDYFCNNGAYNKLLSSGENVKYDCLFVVDKRGKGVKFPSDSRRFGFKEAFKQQAASGNLTLSYRTALIRRA